MRRASGLAVRKSPLPPPLPQSWKRSIPLTLIMITTHNWFQQMLSLLLLWIKIAKQDNTALKYVPLSTREYLVHGKCRGFNKPLRPLNEINRQRAASSNQASAIEPHWTSGLKRSHKNSQHEWIWQSRTWYPLLMFHLAGREGFSEPNFSYRELGVRVSTCALANIAITVLCCVYS